MERFAPYVAVLPWFNSDVLHKLYMNVFDSQRSSGEVRAYRERAITCADLMHSPRVKRVAYNVFILDGDLQDQLRLKMQQEPSTHGKIAEFMISYAWQCRSHFLGPKYVESYLIEGNLILDPSREAERITKHIVNRFNKAGSFSEKKNAVAYHLNLLNREGVKAEDNEIMKFLKGYQSFDPDSGTIPQEWRSLRQEDTGSAETVRIKLPVHIRDSILKEIRANQAPVAESVNLHALYAGVDQYMDERIRPLQAPVNDARMIARYIEGNIAQNAKHIQRVVLSQDATRKNLVALIREIGHKMEAGDTFLFYFAGYGGVENSPGSSEQMIQNQSVQSNIPDSSGEEAVIICYDSFVEEPPFALKELNDLLNEFPVECTALIILDCGFHQNKSGIESSGYTSRSLPWIVDPRPPGSFLAGNEEGPETKPKYHGAVLFGSDPVNEDSDAYEDSDHGFFTRGLIGALEKSGNAISYRELLAGPQSIAWESTRQSADLQPIRSFDTARIFLDGILVQRRDPIQSLIREVQESQANRLDLTGMGLYEIPKEVFELSHLTELEIMNNQITELPPEIEKLENLRILKLSANRIKALPPQIWNLENLEILLADENEISEIPIPSTFPESLAQLSMARNHIKFLPWQFARFDGKRQYDFTGNPMINIPQEFLEGIGQDLGTYIDGFAPVGDKGRLRLICAAGLDYEQRLEYLEEELRMISSIFSGSDVEVRIMMNPNAVELSQFLYQYHRHLSILHIGAFRMDQLQDGNGVIHEMRPVEWEAYFRSVIPEKTSTPLLFLNVCDGAEIIRHLSPSYFPQAIGLPGKVDDAVAFEVAKSFYGALAEGDSVGEAFDKTRRRIAD